MQQLTEWPSDNTDLRVGDTIDVGPAYKRLLHTITEVHTGFVRLTTLMHDYDGTPRADADMLYIYDPALKDFINSACSMRAVYRSEAIGVNEFNRHTTDLVNEANGYTDDNNISAMVSAFADFVTLSDKARRDEYAAMINNGVISFDMLDYHFNKDEAISFGDDDTLEGGVVYQTGYQQSYTGTSFVVTVTQYTTTGSRLATRDATISIPEFGGMKKLDDLPCQHISIADRATLTERGRVWETMALVASYRQYTGKITIGNSRWNRTDISANGRCMIDPRMYYQMVDIYLDVDELSSDITNVPAEWLFTTPNVVMGYSLTKKKWGVFSLAGVSDIGFRDDAYDQLVLDPETKAEVRALVSQSDDMFTDIIAGKGGGAIFLLHGNPGTGKTLTAESVSEILHRPLYSVSIGELGITPKDVEASLQDILEMVMVWDAVLLLDEADIFLEARTKEDIVRNAMVGVFLRMLEYHNGVLFLTTNRVDDFDTAVLSRISVILEYPDFTPEIRKQVWNNILYAAGVNTTSLDIDRLAMHDINGRQIKNVIRIAQALSVQLGVPFDQELLNGRIDRMKNVVHSITNAPDSGPQMLMESA